MKLLAIILCLCLVNQNGLCLFSQTIPHTCQPCIGSDPAEVPSASEPGNRPDDSQTVNCQDLRELIAQMGRLHRNVIRARQHLVETVFDNDDLHTERLHIEQPAGLSWTEIIYNKLSFLYLNLKIIEGRRGCDVNTNYNIADRIPLCHVFGIMRQTEHFNATCRKEGHVPAGCSSFHMFAKRVLTTAAHTFHEIRNDLTGRDCST